jgi:hypothetical protein
VKKDAESSKQGRLARDNLSDTFAQDYESKINIEDAHKDLKPDEQEEPELIQEGKI